LGRGGTILGLTGLVLGAGGLGLGGFAWLSVSSLETQVGNFYTQTTWYRENETAIVTNPPHTDHIFYGLTIEFELGLNESVYFSFMAWAHSEPVTGAWSLIRVYFCVDGIIDTDEHAEVGTYDGDEIVNCMIPLQDVRQDLLVGVHNVTIAVYGTYSGDFIHDSSLFFQKLSS